MLGAATAISLAGVAIGRGPAFVRSLRGAWGRYALGGALDHGRVLDGARRRPAGADGLRRRPARVVGRLRGARRLAPAPRAPRPGPAVLVDDRGRGSRAPSWCSAERPSSRPEFGNESPGRIVDRCGPAPPGPERWNDEQRTQDRRPARRARRALHGGGRRVRRCERPRHRARHRPGLLRRDSYWFTDKLAIGRPGQAGHRAPGPASCTRMVGDLARGPTCRCRGSTCRPELQPNAFATGRNPHHAVVASPQGILQPLAAGRARRACWPTRSAHVKQPRHPHRFGRRRASRSGITFVARMAMWSAIFGGGATMTATEATPSACSPWRSSPRSPPALIQMASVRSP